MDLALDEGGPDQRVGAHEAGEGHTIVSKSCDQTLCRLRTTSMTAIATTLPTPPQPSKHNHIVNIEIPSGKLALRS